MVLDEFYDPCIQVEEESTSAVPENPQGQPPAPPARPSSPVPGPSGWSPPPVRSSTPVRSPETGRRPTRPRNPAPLTKAARRIASPQPLPRPTPDQRQHQLSQARRRTLRPTFVELATLVSDYDRSTNTLSQGLAEHYSLTAAERYQHRHVLRGMRVAQRVILASIRQHYPLGGDEAARTRFLVWMDSFERRINARTPTDSEF